MTGPREVLFAAPRTGESCQRAVRSIAGQVNLALVVGSPKAPNSLRLVEAAQREGVPAHLVDGVSEIDLRWLVGRTRLGITVGASTPPHLVEQIVHCLGGLGPVTAREQDVTREVS